MTERVRSPSRRFSFVSARRAPTTRGWSFSRRQPILGQLIAESSRSRRKREPMRCQFMPFAPSGRPARLPVSLNATGDPRGASRARLSEPAATRPGTRAGGPRSAVHAGLIGFAGLARLSVCERRAACETPARDQPTRQTPAARLRLPIFPPLWLQRLVAMSPGELTKRR